MGPKRHFFIFGSDKILEQWVHKRENHTKPPDEPITGADPGILSSSSEERTVVSAYWGPGTEREKLFSGRMTIGGGGDLDPCRVPAAACRG